MLRLLLACLLTLPAPEPTRINLPDPWFADEGHLSHLTLTDTPAGQRLWVALDISGPDWCYLTLDPSPAGLTLDIRRSSPGGWHLHADYPCYAALLASTDEPAVILRHVLARCGIVVSDLDADCLPPPTPAIMASADAVLRDLGSDAWTVRENASQRLRDDPELRAALLAACRGRHLTPEQAMRLATINP